MNYVIEIHALKFRGLAMDRIAGISDNKENHVRLW